MHCRYCNGLRASLLGEIKEKTDGDKNILLHDISFEVDELCEDEYFYDDWYEGKQPDFSGVSLKMQILLNSGNADVLFSYGDEFLQKLDDLFRDENVSSCGDTGIDSCCELLVDAMKKSKLSGAQKILWAIEKSSACTQCYGSGCKIVEYTDEKLAESAWSEVADTLLDGFHKIESEDSDANNSSRRYYPMRDWLIKALENSGRKSEIIPFCEIEARWANSYTDIVRRLIDDKKYDDAMKWVQEGLSKKEEIRKNDVDQLRNSMMEIYQHQKNWHPLLLCQIEDFVEYASVGTYKSCKDTAEMLSLWPKLRKPLIDYAEKRTLPWKHADWPFPDYSNESMKSAMIGHNDTTRVGIALFEENAQDALEWLDKLTLSRSPDTESTFKSVALLVHTQFPERALAIWKLLAENSFKDSPSYPRSARYMQEIKSLMFTMNLQEKWRDYLENVRKEHWRRRNLMQVLKDL
jgi:uncharacterized Zn finger protein